MKYAVVLFVGFLVGAFASSAVRPAPMDAVSVATPTPRAVYVQPTPVPFDPRHVRVTYMPSAADLDVTVPMRQVLIDGLAGAWLKATKGRGQVVEASFTKYVETDVFVVLYPDTMARIRGNEQALNGIRIVNIFGLTDPTEELRTAVHELGHALGLPHVTEGCAPPHGPIMCSISGDAETFSDDELAKMGL